MTIVDGGPADVSVTSTWPVCETVKPRKSRPPTCTVPLNVSVVRVAVTGVVVGVVLFLVQAVAPKTRTTAQIRIIVMGQLLSCA